MAQPLTSPRLATYAESAIASALADFQRSAVVHGSFPEPAPVPLTHADMVSAVVSLQATIRTFTLAEALEIVDSCGGSFTPEQEACGYADGYGDALDEAERSFKWAARS